MCIGGDYALGYVAAVVKVEAFAKIKLDWKGLDGRERKK